MKPLTEKQARMCEHAKTKRCRCRCAGALHGAEPLAAVALMLEFEFLPQSDAHRLARKPENGRAVGEGGA